MAREKMIRVHKHELDALKAYREANYEDTVAMGLVIRDLAEGRGN